LKILKAKKSLEKYDEAWIRATILLDDGDIDGALFAFKRLAKDGCASALVEVASIYHQMGLDSNEKKKFEKAIEWYKHSIEITDDWESHLGIASVYFCENRDIDLAIFHLDLVINHNKDISALYMRARIYENDSDILRAIDLYRKAAFEGHIMSERRLALIDPNTNIWKRVFRTVIIIFKALKLAANDPDDKRLSFLPISTNK
jgi:FOG: TPR repeat, SEL1 subfamily